VEHGDGERIEMMALAIGVERVRDIQMRCLNTLAISNVLRPRIETSQGVGDFG